MSFEKKGGLYPGALGRHWKSRSRGDFVVLSVPCGWCLNTFYTASETGSNQ